MANLVIWSRSPQVEGFLVRKGLTELDPKRAGKQKDVFSYCRIPINQIDRNFSLRNQSRQLQIGGTDDNLIKSNLELIRAGFATKSVFPPVIVYKDFKF